MYRKGQIRRLVGIWAWAIVVYMIVTTMFFPSGHALAKAYLKVVILKEPKNLNPFQVTDSWTKKVLHLIYQPLYLVDPDKHTLIPWLAQDQPVYDPLKKTVTFHLREMQWDDGSEFSAQDVIFTVNLFKNLRIPKYHAYWRFVEKIVAIDKRTIQMTLERPMAIFSRRSLTSWIVQKKKWEPVLRAAEKRLEGKGTGPVLEEASKMIQAHVVNRPTGLGPFKFASWKKGAYILLLKNDRFFGQGKIISGRRLGPFIDGVMFKIYENLSTATFALKQGQIDFLWKGVSQAFVTDLVPNPNISVPMSLDQGYRYLGFNLRRPPMSDLAFRRAVAYLTDKDFIVKHILHDHGQRLDTLVPPSNTFYYNSNTPAYGKGMDRTRRTQEAYSIMRTSGYRWEIPPLNTHEMLQEGEGIAMPDGKAMPHLSLITPPAHYDTEMAAAGKVVQNRLKDFGFPISWKAVAFSSLVNKVRNERDFDMYIMGWRGLSLDPDYLRRFFYSSQDRPNQWNYPGYKNVEFDKLADLQARTLDLQERRKIVLNLQNKLMTDLPYVPLYVPHRMEGVRSDRFKGWVKQVGGVGNIWTFCLLKPVHN